VKNFNLFIVFLLVMGCGTTQSPRSANDVICPSVLFSSDHGRYIGGDSQQISIDNLTFEATINNAIFLDGCQLEGDNFSSNLSLLFIAQPSSASQEIINLPFYVAVLSYNNDILDIQYYSTTGRFQKNIETQEFEELEIRENVLISNKNEEKRAKVVIGFMLDKKRTEILN